MYHKKEHPRLFMSGTGVTETQSPCQNNPSHNCEMIENSNKYNLRKLGCMQHICLFWKQKE